MRKIPVAIFFALFLCVTAIAQITFSNQTVLLPTSTFHSGNSIGVCDMNNDDKDDIVRANNGVQQYVEFQGAANDTFTELSSNAYIGSPWSMCTGDYNNDGYNDAAWGDGNGSTWVLHWNGSNYTSTNATGVAGYLPDFPQGCNFFDIDNNGFLDVFQCNDNTRAYVILGNGTTTGWTGAQSCINTATSPSSDNSGNYASIWTDINNDGYIDLMITHCRQGVTSSGDPRRIDQVFINNGNGTYTQDVTNWTGLRDGAQGWSTAWGDIDNDGDQDAFVMDYDVPGHLWINNGNGTFADSTANCGVTPSNNYFGQNATFHDFDNDGFLDLLITGLPHHLFRSNGDYTFTEVTGLFPDAGGHPVTAGAVGDLNGDGLLDLYASYCDIYTSPSASIDKLWMNTTVTTNHYVVFDLVGGGTPGYSNTTGIGAIVKIYGAWGVQTREIRSGEGYSVQNTFAAHFGLGSATVVDSVIVLWPSGIVDFVTGVQVDAHNVVNEGAFPTTAPIAMYHPLRMMVSPNPAFENIHVQLFNYNSYGLENLTLQIVDVNGRVVYSEASLTSSDIVLSHDLFAAGLYMVDVSQGNERLAAEKLILR